MCFGAHGPRHLSVRHFRQTRAYRLKRAVAYENLPSKQMRCSCVGARLGLHTIKLEPQLSKMWNGRINRSQDDAFFQSRGSMNSFIHERVMSLPLDGGHFWVSLNIHFHNCSQCVYRTLKILTNVFLVQMWAILPFIPCTQEKLQKRFYPLFWSFLFVSSQFLTYNVFILFLSGHFGSYMKCMGS